MRRRSASARSVPRAPNRPFEEQEKAQFLHELEERLEADEKAAQRARESEENQIRAVQQALREVERDADAAYDEASAMQHRERARVIARRLTELEEERLALIAPSSSTAAALDAHTRVGVATARCAVLQRALVRQPEDAASAFAKQQRSLELEVAALEFDEQCDAILAAAAVSHDHEGWAEARSRTESLMDATEAARITIFGLERDASERDATRKAARKAAQSALQARLAPMRLEVAQLIREAEAIRLTRAEAAAGGGEQAGELRRLEQQQSLIATDVASLKADVARLELEVATLRDQMAKHEHAKAALKAKAKAAVAPPGGPQLPLQPSAPLPPIGKRMEPSQKDRLAALQGKYGAHVGKNLAEGGRRVLGTAGQAGGATAAPAPERGPALPTARPSD